MKALTYISFALVIIGALNWGLVGFYLCSCRSERYILADISLQTLHDKSLPQP